MSSEVKNEHWWRDGEPGSDSAGQQAKPRLNELLCMLKTSFTVLSKYISIKVYYIQKIIDAPIHLMAGHPSALFLEETQ